MEAVDPVTRIAIDAPGSRWVAVKARSATPPRAVCSTSESSSSAPPGVSVVSRSFDVRITNGDSP